MTKEQKRGEGSIFSTIISIIVPLAQLIVVGSTALSSQLKFENFFVKSELLTIVNLLAIFLILSLLGILTVRSQNVFFRKNKKGLLIPESQCQAESLTKAFWYIQIPSFVLLLLVILLSVPTDQNIRAFFQYLLYVIFLVSSGVILYWWFQEYSKRRDQPKPEDFIPNLLDSLRRHKLLKENPVEVLDQAFLQNGKKLIRIKIEDQTEYFLITDFFGLSIENTWDEKSKSGVPEWVTNLIKESNMFQKN